MGDDDAQLNRDLWTRKNAEYTDRAAEQAWSRPEIGWGMFDIPERELDVLGDVNGLDVVELGCGTAYFSAWLARRGVLATYSIHASKSAQCPTSRSRVIAAATSAPRPRATLPRPSLRAGSQSLADEPAVNNPLL